MTHELKAAVIPQELFASVRLKSVGLGFDNLIADVYWLRFIQYVGDIQARQIDHSAQAEKMLTTITLFAPQFIEPYYFASFVVGAEQKRPDAARLIIDRGITANPNVWYLPFIAGFNEYLNAHDSTAAACYYETASRCPGAPTWLARQAKLLKSQEFADIKQLAVWSGIFTSTHSANLKVTSREKLITIATRILHESNSLPARRLASKQLHDLQAPGF